jgi:hypothetical protein
MAIQRTPIEKVRIATQHQEKKALYKTTYANAESLIMGEAMKISSKFGKHTPKQCYHTLLQRVCASQKVRSAS